MSAFDQLPQAADKLRRAIVANTFRDVEPLLAEYCKQVESALAELPPGDGRIQTLARETCELLNWADRTVRAARSHIALRLQQIRPLPAFQTRERNKKTWEMEA